ncbi:MAG TPA: hypothetical protein VHR45_20885 [Thermoanaerobaculia bacterium]|nr:hypothetical protein [Thermoanaerobaculia bacterium]
MSEILGGHVTFELESMDRLYLNLYVPILQRPEGAAYFWIHHRGHRFASSALLAPMTRAFVASIEQFARERGLDVIQFRKGQRKEEVAQTYLKKFPGAEGVLFIGKAQEKVLLVRTQSRRNPKTGQRYPWLVKTTALVNQYYFYCVDRDFGPFFLKLCSYFPYNGKVCLNGHEYLKRQLAHEGVGFEALDNGLLRCDDPARAQRLADGLTAEKIEALVRKWLRLLPHPFTAEDRRAGYRYEISILQAEFSLTQVLDRPVLGRLFFEQIIRDNLDLGRPDRVQLVFGRRITRQTPGRFRTRVITDGVIPTLYIDYKHTSLKQYHKEGRALRTETTVNDTRDFDLGKRLKNLSALRKVGFTANRRLLDVQRISHDCALGEDLFGQLHHPLTVGNQRAPALRFGDQRVLALLSALVAFRLLPHGFAHRHLRQQVGALLGREIRPGQMTYDLRRLRLHGLIERLPKSHRYHVTPLGFRAALFLSRSYARLLRPGLATLGPQQPPAAIPIRQALDRLDDLIEEAWHAQQIAA